MTRLDQLPQDLREHHFFAALAPEQLSKVVKAARRVQLEAGEQLFGQNEVAQYFYYLQQGQIKLSRLSPAGDLKIIEIIEAGQMFAEAVMFMEKHRYPVNAQAVSGCELIAFDMPVFVGLLRESTETCFRLMADMSARLHRRLRDIENLTLHNATYRLVEYLLEHAPAEPRRDAAVRLETPKSVIASRLSIQPETLSRILARLSGEGLISVERNLIRVVDVAGLSRVMRDGE